MKTQNKKTENAPINKKVIILALIIILVITVVICINKKSDSTSNLDEFQKQAIYSYLEENVLDVYTLYQKAGKSEYNEIQVFQSKLKQELDNFFANNDKKSIATSEALGLVDSEYVPENVDFHGIIISGYEYNSEKDVLEKSDKAYANMAGVESQINSMDYSNEKAKVQNIENKC